MAATLLNHVIQASTRFLRPNLIYVYTKSVDVFRTNNVRYLYTAEFLGIDKYVEHRDKVCNQFGSLKEKFCIRMKEGLSKEGQTLVFTEDLKNICYLADDNSEDLDLCLKMMKKFNQQNKELRFGTFVFGPVAMRLFYHFDKPDLVLQALQDEELIGFFDQVASYHIALDLLYKHHQFNDCLKIVDLLQERQLYGTKYPRDCIVLALAACYGLNTPESYKKCLEIVKGAREVGAMILRRGLTMAAALALKQNDANMAMEILALTPQSNYITVRNLKLITLGELNRLDDTFPILRSILNRDIPRGNTKEICQSTIDYLQKLVDKEGNKESAHIFEQVCRALKENNHISEQTIEDLLLIPIKPGVKRDQSWQSGYSNGSTYSQNRRQMPRYGSSPQPGSQQAPAYPSNRRPGIRDFDE